MAATKTKKLNKKISEATDQAKENPYIHRFIEDKELRENAVAALQSVKTAFEQAREDGAQSATEIIKDLEKKEKKLKKGRAAKKAANKAEMVSDAAKDVAPVVADSVKEKKKRHPVRKLIVFAVIGGIVAVVVSEDARKALLDTLFGAEEEFEYTSTTTASAGSANGAS